jgi:Caspase domain
MWRQLVIGLWCLAAFASQAWADRRVALVIGNANYVHFSALANPRNDAKSIADALRASKFDDVMLVENLDRIALNRALQLFSAKSAGADIAIIYYAGHGVEVNGVNYLVPIDAELQRSTDVAYEAIPLDLARNSVAAAAKLRMVILDACRNNPFKLADVGGVRAAKRGLRSVEADASEFIAYSAKEGTTAQDGPPDGNSPFAVALVNAIKQPGLEVRLMFGKVKDDVVKATNKEQEPFTYTSLGGDPVFLNPPEEKPAVVEPPPPPPMLAINMAWAEVKLSKSSAVVEGFKQQYRTDPNFAVFGALADERLLALSTKAEVRPSEVSLELPPLPKLEGDLTVMPKSDAKPKPAEVQVAALPPPEPIVIPPAVTEPDPPALVAPTAPTTELIISMQRELKRVGCYTGAEDGKWGRKADAALLEYNRVSGAKLESLKPSEEVLAILQSAGNKSCADNVIVPQKSFVPKAKIVVRKPETFKLFVQKPRAIVRKQEITARPKRPQRPTKLTSIAAPKKITAKPPTKVSNGGKKRVCKPEFVVIAVVVRCHGG